jgi:hypothetical protein
MLFQSIRILAGTLFVLETDFAQKAFASVLMDLWARTVRTSVQIIAQEKEFVLKVNVYAISDMLGRTAQ